MNNFNLKSDNVIKLEIITPLPHLLWIPYGEEIYPEKKKDISKAGEILEFVLKSEDRVYLVIVGIEGFFQAS